MPVRVLCSTEDGVELRTLHRGLATRIFQSVETERAHLGRWLPWVHATQGLPDTVKFIQNARDAFLLGEALHGAIWCENQFAGMMALRVTRKTDRVGSIGYWVRSDFQGKGVVTRLLRAFIPYCFREWRMHRLELHCATDNEKSARVAERLGFRLEGVMRESQLINGVYTDMKLYALLASEWPPARRNDS
jgi:ribosomal-protein-serine acetyltransferase